MRVEFLRNVATEVSSKSNPVKLYVSFFLSFSKFPAGNSKLLTVQSPGAVLSSLSSTRGFDVAAGGGGEGERDWVRAGVKGFWWEPAAAGVAG